jgi:hypothetical protein
VRRLQRLLELAQQATGVAVGQRRVEAALVAEVPVEDRLGDAGLRRDGRHGRGRPVATDDAVGGVEQRLRRAARSSRSGTVMTLRSRASDTARSLRSRDLVPEMARLMMRRWISLVPSKIV